MPRSIIVVLLAVLSASTVTTAQEVLPQPDTLLNWLRIIDMPDARLLYAADLNGHYFAVKIDADRDILFCHRKHTRESTAPGTFHFGGVFRLEVLDTEGRNLHDHESKKKSPDMVRIRHRTEFPSGHVSVTCSYSRGSVFPIREPDEPEVLVRYIADIPVSVGVKKRVLLSQRIQLPPEQERSP